MKVTVKIYSKSKQTKAEPLTDAQRKAYKTTKSMPARVKHTSIATRTLDTLVFDLKGNQPLAEKLATLQYMATRAIGARVKAFLSVDRRLPSTIFFSIELDGKVFSSETIVTQANMKQVISISMAKLKDSKDVIGEVAATQVKGLKAAATYLVDLREISVSAAKLAKGGETFLSVDEVIDKALVEPKADVVPA